MQIRKAYRYRFNPNAPQRGKLAVQFGHTCFVYNWLLALREEHYQQHVKGLSRKATIKLLPALNAERSWLYEADSQALQQALIDLDKSYQQFLDSCYWETVQATPNCRIPEKMASHRGTRASRANTIVSCIAFHKLGGLRSKDNAFGCQSSDW